jgi:uncharacterized protein (TIGR00725 family)
VSNAQWVAILGGATCYTREQLSAAYVCGRELAGRQRHVITGATSGIPCAAALGAKDNGGFVVGISPARNAAEHIENYRKPLTAMDLVIYSGLSLDGRAPLILRSAGAAIFIGGEMGTLAEFAAGWLCGCPILGLLERMGGITADLRRISNSMRSWGSSLVASGDPLELVDEICRRTPVTAASRSSAREARQMEEILAVVGELRAC